MSVKYQVERRPIGPDGKIYRGLNSGDYITVPTNSNALLDTFRVDRYSLGLGAQLYQATASAKDYDASKNSSLTSNMIELTGEPWIVHSTHFSIDSALSSVAPLASAVGSENVRIVKVLSHAMELKLK